MTLPLPIAARVQRDGDCLVYTGPHNPDGYGTAWVGSNPARKVLAHRFVYEAEHGPIPTGLVIDHLCRRRDCVDTAHMEVVTRRENTLRGVGPTAVNAEKSACPSGHPYDAGNTYFQSDSKSDAKWRVCKECHRARKRRLRLTR